jgi:hypothetical protein
VFADMVRHGPAVLAVLPDAARQAVADRIDDGFSAAFLAVAVFAVLNALLAWTTPLRRL